MEHRDQSLSTRDLASSSVPPEASAGRDDRMRGGSPVADHDSASGTPDVVPAEGPVAADNESPEGNAERDAMTPRADEPVPAPGGDAGREAAASGSRTRSDNGTDREGTLLSNELSVDFRARWESVQTQFVDEPRGAVQDADKLVATVMQKLAEGFALERERLEAQWDRGEDISTEDLRVALRRYRSFFERLLSA